jgi:hypothetical protein
MRGDAAKGFVTEPLRSTENKLNENIRTEAFRRRRRL